jgi:uncharacterized ferritin-like protein (DUF455 family)
VALTVQKWSQDFLEADSLLGKCKPKSPPLIWDEASVPLFLTPTRPRELHVSTEQPESFTLTRLRDEDARCRLMHKFWHHELQAAELMAWALLRFAESPRTFREGLFGILRDELRHMGLYQDYLERRGRTIGDYPVRDFLWQRVGACDSPLAFVALFGMGMEAVNLEHSARFEARLSALGDEEGAGIQRQIGLEEIAHVRFATHWFRTWTGGLEFERFRAELPPDLPPLAVRGKRLQTEARLGAGMSSDFLAQLSAWGRE